MSPARAWALLLAHAPELRRALALAPGARARGEGGEGGGDGGAASSDEAQGDAEEGGAAAAQGADAEAAEAAEAAEDAVTYSNLVGALCARGEAGSEAGLSRSEAAAVLCAALGAPPPCDDAGAAAAATTAVPPDQLAALRGALANDGAEAGLDSGDAPVWVGGAELARLYPCEASRGAREAGEAGEAGAGWEGARARLLCAEALRALLLGFERAADAFALYARAEARAHVRVTLVLGGYGSRDAGEAAQVAARLFPLRALFFVSSSSYLLLCIPQPVLRGCGCRRWRCAVGACGFGRCRPPLSTAPLGRIG